MREPCPDCRCLTSSAPDPCEECAAKRKRAAALKKMAYLGQEYDAAKEGQADG